MKKTNSTIVVLLFLLYIVLNVSGQGFLRLDVGNDTDYEYTEFNQPQLRDQVDVTSAIKNYVSGGCWCVGCVYDPASQNCTVPVVLDAGSAGNLTVHDIELSYTRYNKIAEVGYGEAFRNSKGACWAVSVSMTEIAQAPVPVSYKPVCVSPEYTYLWFNPSLHLHPSNNVNFWDEDAVDDAMYRLLNESLDLNNNGALEEIGWNSNMQFNAQGRIGVQRMWGPLEMRLVVWA